MIYDKYLITGATGFLGNNLIKNILARNTDDDFGVYPEIRALVLPGDPLSKYLPKEVSIVYGRVDDGPSLSEFFRGNLNRACLIHCASIVSIASKNTDILRKVNVNGTKNILNRALEAGIQKTIYVSSVHAIPELPIGEQISECNDFSPENVIGHYAKTKAEATSYAIHMAKVGLDVSIVHPSGIIGPNDIRTGNITNAISSYINGKLKCSVSGGYDFVDVRDVANGIIACSQKGEKGECYILSNSFYSIDEILSSVQSISGGKKIACKLSHPLIRMIAPFCELASRTNKKPMFLTPYSAYTLRSNANFSHKRASQKLNYKPRSISETLPEMVSWIKTKRQTLDV